MFPILIEFGPVTLYTYGLFVALGIFAGLNIAIALARQDGVSKESTQNYFYRLLIYFVLGGILGARIFYVVLFWEQFSDDLPAIFKIHQGGLVSYGALFGAMAGFYLCQRKEKHFHWRRVLDWLAPALAFGHALGRLGCFSAGCCYGVPTAKFWGVVFRHPHSLAPTGILLHPTQIVEFIFLIFLGSFLLWRFFHWKNHPLRRDGLLFIHYLMIYALGRFAIEFFRGDQSHLGFFTQGQVLTLFALVGVLFFRFCIVKNFLLTKLKKSD